MVTKEMKQELINKINSIKDENVLEEVYRFLEVGTQEVERVVLSTEQKNLVDQGISDIEKGNYKSHAAANLQIEGWLKHSIA